MASRQVFGTFVGVLTWLWSLISVCHSYEAITSKKKAERPLVLGEHFDYVKGIPSIYLQSYQVEMYFQTKNSNDFPWQPCHRLTNLPSIKHFMLATMTRYGFNGHDSAVRRKGEKHVAHELFIRRHKHCWDVLSRVMLMVCDWWHACVGFALYTYLNLEKGRVKRLYDYHVAMIPTDLWFILFTFWEHFIRGHFCILWKTYSSNQKQITLFRDTKKAFLHLENVFMNKARVPRHHKSICVPTRCTMFALDCAYT